MTRYEEFLQREPMRPTGRMHVLRLINYILLFYVLGTLPLYLYPERTVLLCSALIFALTITISEVVRYRKTPFILFLLVQAVLTLAIYYVGDLVGVRYYYLPLAIIPVILAFYAHIEDTDLCVPQPIYLLPYVVSFFVALYLENALVMRVSFLAEALCALVYLIYRNDQMLLRHIYQLQEDTAVPVAKIHRTNSFMILILSFGMTVLIGLFSMIDYGEELVRLIRKGMQVIVQWIAAFLRLFARAEEEDVLLPQEAMDEADLSLLSEVTQPNPMVEMILDIIMRLLTCAIILLIAYLIVRLLIRLYHAYITGGRKADADRIEYLKPREEKERIPRGTRPHRSILQNLQNDMTVRRLYRNYLLKSPKASSLTASMTPTALEHTAYPEETADPMIHSLYEEARYLGRRITSEEVRTYRKTLKEHGRK